MPGLVEGKVMLVTGGGSGIGRATALKLTQEGATVMIADYVQEGGERTVKMIKDSGGTASFIHADVSLSMTVLMSVLPKSTPKLPPFRLPDGVAVVAASAVTVSLPVSVRSESSPMYASVSCAAVPVT